jgi:hypothetical protein
MNSILVTVGLAVIMIVASNTDAAIDLSLPRFLLITVDGTLTNLCIDGENVKLDSISKVETLKIVPLPDDENVHLGVKVNNGNPGWLGLIAADTTGTFVSDSSWTCHINAECQCENTYCAANFNAAGLDGWNPAVEVGNYDDDTGPGEIVGPLPSGVKWIWTHNDPTNNGIIYCSVTIPKLPPPDPPVIIDGSERVVYKIVGEPFTAWAVALGATSQSSWTKDGTTTVSSDPAVHIAAVSTADAGDYRTTFSNSGGSADFIVTLVVYVPPVLSGGAYEHHEVSAGGSVTFNNLQVIAGYPTPTVQWYKDGVPIATPAGFTLNGVIADATYAVVATNLAGVAAHYAYVRIPPGPLFIGPSSLAVVERNSATPTTLYCAVYGGDPSDRPVATWTKGGLSFTTNADASVNDGVVFFAAVDADNAGEYVCTFADNGGRSVSHTITLVVNDAPVMEEPFVENVQASGGNEVCLECRQVRGTPVVDIQWYHDGVLESTTNAPLCISSADSDDIGQYACVRTNAYGDDIKHVNLNVPMTVVRTTGTEFIASGESLLVGGCIKFGAKALGTVEIRLSSTGYYQFTITDSDVTLSENGGQLATVPASEVLNGIDVSKLWISVTSGGVISIGSGETCYSNTLVSHTDATPLAGPFNVQVASGAGGYAVFVFYP